MRAAPLLALLAALASLAGCAAPDEAGKVELPGGDPAQVVIGGRLYVCAERYDVADEPCGQYVLAEDSLFEQGEAPEAEARPDGLVVIGGRAYACVGEGVDLEADGDEPCEVYEPVE